MCNFIGELSFFGLCATTDAQRASSVARGAVPLDPLAAFFATYGIRQTCVCLRPFGALPFRCKKHGAHCCAVVCV